MELYNFLFSSLYFSLLGATAETQHEGADEGAEGTANGA